MDQTVVDKILAILDEAGGGTSKRDMIDEYAVGHLLLLGRLRRQCTVSNMPDEKLFETHMRATHKVLTQHISAALGLTGAEFDQNWIDKLAVQAQDVIVAGVTSKAMNVEGLSPEAILEFLRDGPQQDRGNAEGSSGKDRAQLN